MSAEWDEYIRLLDEAAALGDKEAQVVAQAEVAYTAEARRLQNTLALAEREFTALNDRNTRLQVGVRDLVRSVGGAVPARADLPALAASEIGAALKSAEYDLGELRRSLEYMKGQKQALVKHATAPPAPPPPRQPIAPSAEVSISGPLVWACLGVAVVVLIALAVILL